MNKIQSGISGLDAILHGGFLEGSPTLIKGGPGTGKTFICMAYIAAQLLQGKSAVIVTCDEAPDRLVHYINDLGTSGTEYVESGKLKILDFRPNFDENIIGDYKLSPILMRITDVVEQTNASILALDSLQNLLLGLGVSEPGIELFDIFDWVRDHAVTTLITMPLASNQKNNSIFEEYAVDCVIRLKQKIKDNLMTRYLRVEKMRGSSHGTNEYPFSLTREGVVIFPITSSALSPQTQLGYISTGIEQIDDMLGGRGYLKGSSLMVSGGSGCGKTILAAICANAALIKGHKVTFFSFEEAQTALIHNLKSAGVDFTASIEAGNLEVFNIRTVEKGMEEHLISIIHHVEKRAPDLLILDPISAFTDMGSKKQVKMFLIRFVSFITSILQLRNKEE